MLPTAFGVVHRENPAPFFERARCWDSLSPHCGGVVNNEVSGAAKWGKGGIRHQQTGWAGGDPLPSNQQHSPVRQKAKVGRMDQRGRHLHRFAPGFALVVAASTHTPWSSAVRIAADSRRMASAGGRFR